MSPSYQNSAQKCNWVITASPGNTVVVSFTSFSIPDSELCKTDHVDITSSNWNGVTNSRFESKKRPSGQL
jgi:hypothetical protein